MVAKKRNISTAGKKRRRPDPGLQAGEITTTNRLSRKTDNHRVSDNAFSQLKYASVILVVAMVLGIAWNKMESADPRMISFLSDICRAASCAPFVIPVQRNLQAARLIKQGETLYTIPRNLQFWDLDALRDSFVRKHLLSARHAPTGNALSSGAFLAAWIALKLKESQAKLDATQKSYLKLLPSSEHLMHHPLMWEKQNLKDALGGIHSLNYAVAQTFREMVESEYTALVKASKGKYSDTVSELDYKVARINVLSRSFNPGPGAAEGDMDDEEMEFYIELGFNFTTGCQALVPVLDMLNHHPNPNVGYRYVKAKRAFVIDAKTQIPAGWELYDSYGKFTDSHLFAKFGFVNGDGSGWTQGSIALFHRMLDAGLEEFSYGSHAESSNDNTKAIQRKHLTRYLQYDDGYTDCVEGPDVHPEEFALKKLKLEHLLQVANNRKHWIVNVPPRSPESRPGESSSTINVRGVPELDPRRTNIGFSKLIETCRIISLVNSDYDGRALRILKENFGNSDFVLKKDSDSLEYRAVSCLARLAGTSLAQYSRNLEEEKKHLMNLNDNENHQSPEWTTSHLRLGEMQVLHLLSRVTFSIAKRLEEKLDKTAQENMIRDRPCPKEFLEGFIQNLDK